jgi:hypothetical protein
MMLSGCSILRLQTNNNICDILITEEKLSVFKQKELTKDLARAILIQDLYYNEYCSRN